MHYDDHKLYPVSDTDMLLTFPINMDADKSKEKRPEESLDADKYKRQQESGDAANEVLVIPHSPNSVPTPSSGQMVLGTGAQFPDNLLLCPQELKSEELAPQTVTARSATHDPAQVLLGFGTQFITAVDPRHAATTLENELQSLGSSNK